MEKAKKIYIAGAYRHKRLIGWLTIELEDLGHKVGSTFTTNFMKMGEGFKSFAEYIESKASEEGLAEQLAEITNSDFVVYVGGENSTRDIWALLGAAYVSGVTIYGVDGRTDAGLMRKLVKWFVSYGDLLGAIK